MNAHMSNPERIEADARSGREDEFWGEVVSGDESLAAVYRLEPLTRISMVREGVPADLLSTLAKEMAMPREKLYATIGLARATANRKLQSGQRLSQDESERVLGMLRLVGQAEAIVAASGEPAGFDAAKWVAAWLDRPHPALGNQRPAAFMDTAEGRVLVSDLLAQMQSSAYA
jgi:putative toxin-antitoxin system antitoxin component (TIGR02293 family)